MWGCICAHRAKQKGSVVHQMVWEEICMLKNSFMVNYWAADVTHRLIMTTRVQNKDDGTTQPHYIDLSKQPVRKKIQHTVDVLLKLLAGKG